MEPGEEIRNRAYFHARELRFILKSRFKSRRGLGLIRDRTSDRGPGRDDHATLEHELAVGAARARTERGLRTAHGARRTRGVPSGRQRRAIRSHHQATLRREGELPQQRRHVAMARVGLCPGLTVMLSFCTVAGTLEAAQRTPSAWKASGAASTSCSRTCTSTKRDRIRISTGVRDSYCRTHSTLL